MARLSARHVVWALIQLVLTVALVSSLPAGRAGSATRGHVISAPMAYDGESWFRLQRAYPNGRTPPADALARALRDTRPVVNPRLNVTLPGDRWVSIGPQPIYVPSNTTPTTFSGRVTAVAPHPTNAAVLYIGTDSGGIWRTIDNGTTWASLTDAVPVPAIQSLVLDPINPNLVYATTIHRTYGTRWLRSTDGGSSWDVSSIVTDRGETLSPVLCSVNVLKACIPPSSGRIIIDPSRAGSPNTSTIYYVGASHLLRSDDSGRTFRSVLALPVDLDFAGPNAATDNPEAPYLRDAAIDPARPGRLFGVVARPKCLDQACATMSSAIAIYRSTDGGGHWDQQDVATLNTYSLQQTRYADPGAVYVPRARVAVAPSNPDVIAAAFRDLQLTRPRVVRSVDGGDHWAETAQVTTSLTWPLGLAFSPTDANTMYVSSNGVYRTTNGGQSWAGLGPFHSDNIALTFNANRELLVGGDGGLYLNTTGTTLVPQHTALPITEFYSIAAHPSNGLLMAGGTQDNGTVQFQGSLGWYEIVGGDGGDVVFDPNPQSIIVYAEVEWYFDTGGNVYSFFRCQPTVVNCQTRNTGIDRTLDGPFIPRMALDASNPATLWLTAEKLFRTDNRADSWVAASPSIGAVQRCWQDPAKGRLCADGGYFTAAAVAPSNSQVVYAGALNGDVWVTTNRGATWTSIAGPNAGSLPVRNVNDIVVDPLDSRIAYVSYSGFDSGGSGIGHLFRTMDGGQTWQNLTGSLPDIPVNTILIDPDSVSSTSPSRVLFIGTDIGVFRSTLDGNWQVFGSGLPPVVVNRLAYNATTRQLLAATYGRGIWAISSRFTR